jgi:flagellar assembly factor FliW
MEIRSSRFGSIEVDDADILHFPEGLFGFAGCRDFVLLGDEQNGAVAWLQSIDQPEVGLAVVSPTRFVPGFRMRVARRELEPLKFDQLRGVRVLVIVGKSGRGITLNLKAPLVVNLERRLGRQVVTNGGLPLEYEVAAAAPALKMIA